VVGPAVPLDRLSESLALAEAALRLRTGDRAAEPGPFFVEEHLDALLVHQDRRLLEALRAHSLEPLAAATPSSRALLEETLRSWLLHMGNQRAVATELHIHPQTVRYRLGRLREVFGPALDDPEVRRRLFLALAWEDVVPPS
jgi:DNA-binding PucR family transcriptional regulator